MQPLCSLVKILTKEQNSISTWLVLCRDFLPGAKISLFRVSYQPKKTEQPCEVRALQDGEPSHCEVSHTEGRLDDKNRPEGCLLNGTSSSPVPTSPPLQSECRVIQIPMSPLWPMHGPESIHKSPETSHRAVENPTHQTCDLHGRHAAHGLFRTVNPRTHLHSPISPREPGVHHQ